MLNENVGILERDGQSISTSISTIPRLLLNSVDTYLKDDAFKFKRNGQWVTLSYNDFLLRVEELFFALRTLGVKAGDRIAIMSENRVEWAVADYAALCLGACTVPIYSTLSAPQVEILLRDCAPGVVFLSTDAELEKFRAMAPIACVRYVIAFDPIADGPGILQLDALYGMGRQSAYDYPGEFRSRAMAVDPEDIATIIYTSGTTGGPKGAMLTHRNLVSNILDTGEVLPLNSDDVNLSFLPLAHIFQRHVDYASVHAGATIAYAENPAAVAENMAEVRPTFAAGVPRFFEKMYARILSEASRGPAIRRVIFEKAIRLGREFLTTRRTSLAYRAADRVVFQKIRERMGGRIRFFISGGAALEQEIAEFFAAVGIPVFEGYGLTETSPVIALNGPRACRFGSVGRVMQSVEVRIAADGEILVRGPSVMKGYYGLKRETADALLGGWFYTGDIGELDADGYLKITGRKKDLIVTSSGKNIAPQPIENRLKMIPYFENVVLVGDGRQFITALIVPNYEALAAYARTHGIAFEHPADLIESPEINALAMREIERQTADLSSFEKIRKVLFLGRPFTIEGGELTPTLKVRRSAVEKKYQDNIDRLYAA